MGYLTEKSTATVYRSISAIELSPSDDSLRLTITEGIDVPQPDGSVRFVPTRADFRPDIGAQGPALINMPLGQLAPALGVTTPADIAAMSIRQIIVGLVDYALTPQPAPEPEPEPPAPDPDAPPA